MNGSNLRELTDLVSEFVDLSSVRVSEGAVFGEDIPIDSRDMLRLLSRVEARYGVRFRPQDLLAMRTLGDLLKLIARQGGAA
jgi:acyl carrier protein